MSNHSSPTGHPPRPPGPNLRIAFVCADPDVALFGSLAGSVRFQEVIRSFVRLGARVEVFASAREGAVPPDLASVRLHALPGMTVGDPQLDEVVLQHANGALWSALWREGPFDLIYERYSLWSVAGMMYARLQRIPGVLEVLDPLVETRARERRLIARAKAAESAGRVFAAATAVVAASDPVARYVERFPGACGAVHVIPCGVDTGRFSPGVGPSLPAPPGVFTIGFAGTSTSPSDLDLLARSLSVLRRLEGRVRLLVIGEGPGQRALRASLEAEGVDGAATFTGEVGPREVPGLVASTDVGLVPCPSAGDGAPPPPGLLEFMAAGRPVVTPGAGGACGLVQDGVTGLLFRPGDEMSLAASLSRLRAGPELRERMGAAARGRVLRDHGWDSAVNRILSATGISRPPTPFASGGP